MAERYEEFITLGEAARQVRLSVATLKRYIYSGHLRTYRTPGGRHRVRRADLDALMGVAPASAEGQIVPRPRTTDEDSLHRIERSLNQRLGRLEMDMERFECSLDAIVAALQQQRPPRPEEAAISADAGSCDIRVLGPGCRACDRLANLVEEIARTLGIGSDAVHRVKKLEDIAEYGPTPMPALVVNNRLVSAGRTLSKSRLTELLRNVLPN